MEEKLREYKIPLLSLESNSPLSSFDIIGFSLQYELTYTNVLNILDLAGISLLSEDRGEEDSLIIAGGPCAFNPEPLADFIDLFVIGDGEDITLELIDLYRECRQQGRDKREFLRESANLGGIYIPSLYKVDYEPQGPIKSITPLDDNIPSKVIKRVVADLNEAFHPTKPVIPFVQAVHDRAVLEVMRGCTRGCRFCQAGMIYRPVRERSLANLLNIADELLANTGYEEISLMSLSSSDYTRIADLISALMNKYADKRVSISLPSLRVDSFSLKLAREVQQVRKTGLTFAPEAATSRLRQIINKNISDEDLLETIEGAFSLGWRTIKLYFMIGLPTEEEEDLQGISDLVREAARIGKRIHKGAARVNVTVSSFVPKAHTPFQWEAQISKEMIEEKHKYLRSHLRERNVKLNLTDSDTSILEGVFARGDRRVGKVLYRAWQLGARFDSWREHFDPDLWERAFRDTGIDPNFYTCRERGEDEILPWDMISTGVDKRYLLMERRRAKEGIMTPDCRFERCAGCGIRDILKVENLLAKDIT